MGDFQALCWGFGLVLSGLSLRVWRGEGGCYSLLGQRDTYIRKSYTTPNTRSFVLYLCLIRTYTSKFDSISMCLPSHIYYVPLCVGVNSNVELFGSCKVSFKEVRKAAFSAQISWNCKGNECT